MDWNELRERLSSLPALEQRMEYLLGQIWEAKNNVASLLNVYEQERINTQRIQKESLSTSLLKLAGRYNDRLEREQNLEIRAKLEYDQAVSKLSYLRGEQQELGKRIAELKKDEQKYDEELANRRQKSGSELSGADSEEYALLGKEHDEIVKHITVVKETLAIASRVHASAQKALKCMQNAKSWSSVDAFSGDGSGMISHIAKYDHLDTAEANFNALSSQLGELKSGLQNVPDFTVPDTAGIEKISSDERAVDFWFDNVFAGLSKKKSSSASEIQQITTDIAGIISALETKLYDLNTALKQNKRREEELVLK